MIYFLTTLQVCFFVVFFSNQLDDIWAQALNHRLGTKNLNVRQAYEIAQKRGISFTGKNKLNKS